MVAKSFNSFVALCNLIITICFSINSILTIQVLLKSGDIKINPGPKVSSAIEFCQELAAHDFVKVPLIDAFITEHKFDFVRLSETILD